jgi:hypothetical protein
MKKIFVTFMIALFAHSITTAQDYLEIVTFEGSSGINGTFTTVGVSSDKKAVETNAVKSLFHTLLFTGVEGVNDGERIVCNENPIYTNSFFNSSARYAGYLISCEETAKPKKIAGAYQGTYRVTLRLLSLINDVRKNTGYDDKLKEEKKKKENEKRLTPKPKIIVVPFKRDGENYKSILENDRDLRAAVSEVQKGFENLDIETENILSSIGGSSKRRALYEENADAADSNDKQLLMSSDADVYVVVDLEKNISASGSSVSVIMTAYETATDNIWATENSWTNKFRTTDVGQLCAYAVRDYLPPFLEQIIKNFNEPTSAVIQFSVSNSSGAGMRDRCNNGRRISDVIQEWLDDNAHDSEYHVKGIVDESAIFDDVLIPKADKRGKKMNADKFASLFSDALYEVGVETRFVIEGNNIIITITSVE